MISIKKLHRVETEATPGEWEAICEITGGDDSGKAERVRHAVACRLPNGLPKVIADVRNAEDAEIIIAARNALPKLLDELERLRAENAALEKRWSDTHDDYVDAAAALYRAEEELKASRAGKAVEG